MKKEAETIESERVRDLTGLALIDVPKRLAESARKARAGVTAAAAGTTVSAFNSAT